ncbi:hypothetical protein BOTNAR_0186g00090 [Botryotinia narcissicola]|uniref:Uncharacterized protein n=1 Tax=Botryotinia narcissicola TaxID=278944 RepID=A0A4Z1IGD0_9HELO|nr:hypothetical protein BOTNAR_0186g00090 [Botryotinia narcissicola]
MCVWECGHWTERNTEQIFIANAKAISAKLSANRESYSRTGGRRSKIEKSKQASENERKKEENMVVIMVVYGTGTAHAKQSVDDG